ncbi:MAG: choice-of-anchor A family protein, partial [Chloroflexaceae bacterium]
MNGRFRAAKMFAVLFITTLLTFNWFFLPVDAKTTTTRDAPEVFSVASAESCSVNPLGVANDFNVFMLGNMNQTSDAEGRVAAAGDVELNSYGIGNKLSPDSSRDDLIVGGDLVYTNGEVFNGSAVYGGTADITNVGFPNGDHRQGSPMDFAAAEAYLLEVSAAWANLSANGETVVKPWGAIELNGDDADLNVFALSGTDLADTNSFTINVPAGSTVLVNVDGSTAGMQNFEYFFEENEYVLYNFFEATDLTFSSIGIQGTVLAPQADIVFNNGQINGTMIGASISGSGEFHHNLFAGCLPVPEEEEEPTATPEPTNDYQLNLSHIMCAEDDDAPAGVEVHFVLLNVEDGITPGAVTYTLADGSSFEVEPTKNSGNVWHYFDYQPDGYYDVQSAEVDVDGVTVTLHNPGDYAGDYECSPEPTAEPTVAPTDVPANTVKPITECVANNGDGTYTAHFGYLNTSSTTISIPVGPGNRFSPDPQDRGQPTMFEPGRTPYWPDTAFNMVFDADETLVWTLNGKTATASKNGVPCSYHVFVEKEWYDVDGNLMDAPPAELSTDYAITVEGDLGTGTCSYPAGSDSLECTYDNTQPPALDNKGLWVPFGEAYTVTETGLPDGWEAVAGVGEFTAGDGYCETGRDGVTKYCTHTVENQAVVLPTATQEPTATPETYVEPEFLACPAGLEEVGTFADYVRRDKAPKSHTYDLNLDSDAMITVVGLVKEGHPEVGCPGGSRCEQGQMQEEFDLAINGEVIGAYTDQGNVDAWFEIGPWETEAVVPMDSDEMVTTHLHINDGRGAESVDYKLTVCAEPVETPTATPEPQPDPKVEFDDPDTALCVLDPSDLIVTGNVTLPNDIESARLQLTWHVVHPADLRTEKIYKSITDVPDGYTFEVDSTFFGVDYLWPGVRPGDEVVEVHFGAMLLDSVTGNPIMDMGAGLDYYWYPWVCDAPTPTPTVEPTNEPEPIDDWKSGDAAFECTQIGDYAGAYKIDAAAPNGTYAVDGNGDTITVSNSDGKVFDWSSTFGIGAVIVKAGRGANVWYYDPQATSDTGLYAYENKDISHVTFCWQDPSVDPTSTPEPTETPEIGVCVPGPID